MKIDYYLSSGGKNYVMEFISCQPIKSQKKILRGIDDIKKWGFEAARRARLIRKLHGYDIYEIVIRFNKVFYRIFCVLREMTLILIHAFCKKTNDTPMNEIVTVLGRVKLLNLSYVN